MNSGRVARLQFHYRELVGETVALREMARGFLEADGQVLVALERALDRIGEMPNDHRVLARISHHRDDNRLG